MIRLEQYQDLIQVGISIDAVQVAGNCWQLSYQNDLELA